MKSKANAKHYRYPYKRLYTKLRRGAERKQIDLELTYEDFLEFTKEKECYYCGEDIKWVPHGKKATAYNLDRRVNTEGYTKLNTVVCCKTCNFFKSSMDGNEFLLRIQKIYDNILR